MGEYNSQYAGRMSDDDGKPESDKEVEPFDEDSKEKTKASAQVWYKHYVVGKGAP